MMLKMKTVTLKTVKLKFKTMTEDEDNALKTMTVTLKKVTLKTKTMR
jgi:hypothetical protein